MAENKESIALSDLAEEKILVLDFGSQYAQLIARRVREQSGNHSFWRSCQRLRKRCATL
jgi:hypothetical protein